MYMYSVCTLTFYQRTLIQYILQPIWNETNPDDKVENPTGYQGPHLLYTNNRAGSMYGKIIKRWLNITVYYDNPGHQASLAFARDAYK